MWHERQKWTIEAARMHIEQDKATGMWNAREKLLEKESGLSANRDDALRKINNNISSSNAQAREHICDAKRNAEHERMIAAEQIRAKQMTMQHKPKRGPVMQGWGLDSFNPLPAIKEGFEVIKGVGETVIEGVGHAAEAVKNEIKKIRMK